MSFRHIYGGPRQAAYELLASRMTDVYDRVRAVFEISSDFLTESIDPPAESLFGRDAALVGFRTYDIVRTRWSTGVTNLKVAADMSQAHATSLLGTHLVALRSALLSTARGLWILSSFEPEERVARAAGVVMADRRRGREAMQAASEAATDPGFSGVAGRLEQARRKIEEELQRAGISPIRPPSETQLVIHLGNKVDDYYGGAGRSKQDALVLWSASSSLSHGERWFAELGKPIAKIVTDRSLDVVCSGLNLLWQCSLTGLTTGVRFPWFPDTKADPPG
ncbi:hypothetical protein [Paenarthrobacter aurescens]|jgi:hypothetical protein|uniref:hypothetical protein n=1 Tax=Paenarthrobacter aurescens TaxID=43663 RepID=UPI0005C19FE4|nr:hypothetical protein [Paenarthrobacter aurescens]